MHIQNTQVYTIEVRDAAIVVHDGRMAKSRLKYHAPGLEIYVIGRCPIYKRDKVNYHAFEIAVAHHYPLIQLRCLGWA